MQLNLSRMTKLMKRDWVLYKKPVLYGLAALIIFLLGSIILEVMVTGYQELDIMFYFNLYQVFLLAGGLLLTSIVMWEFKSPESRIEYLAIPASNLEKTVSRWIYTLILYPLVLTLIFFLLYTITSTLHGAVRWNRPLGDFSEYMTRAYLVGHSIVFVFAIWFNKYVLPKGALLSLLVILIGAFIAAILFRIVFHNLFDGWSITESQSYSIDAPEEFKHKAEHFYFPLIKNFLSYIAPLFFYVVAYFKMTEKEV